MIVLAISDITEQQRVYDELKAASADLLRSNEELDHFASVASHDLQEPMRMIRIYGELLKRRLGDKLDAPAVKLLDMVIDGARRMQDLIRSLLEYSRAGNDVLVIQAVDMQEIVAGVRINLDRLIHRAKASIDCGPLPKISGDGTSITRLVQNLFSNALKFRSKDRPCVITVRAVESERDWTFTVADNGIGIRKEDFDRIFRIFQRLNAPGEYTGNGIGLASCKKIVERHHGRLWVESQQQVGTTFFFSLPKLAAPVAKIEA
jgi:light-regulated signal transduction histidine kinase (bacteriophytochrome)